MKTVVCKNGVSLTWDDTLTVGELVTTYTTGYHILQSMDFREDQPPLMHYVKVANAAGMLVNSNVIQSCDASYVQRMTRDRVNADHAYAIATADIKRDNLLQFIPERQ